MPTSSLVNGKAQKDPAGKSSVGRTRFAWAAVSALLVPAFLPLSAIRTKLWQYRRFVLTLFFAIFGSTMVLGVGDAFAHFRRLQYFETVSFDRFIDDLWLIL